MKEAKLKEENPDRPPHPILESMENPDDAEKEYNNHNISMHSHDLIKEAMLEQGISCSPSKTDPDKNHSSGAADMEGVHQDSNEIEVRKGKRVMEFEESRESWSKRKKDYDNLEWVTNVDMHDILHFEHEYDLNFPPREIKENDLFPFFDMNSFGSSDPSNLESSWSCSPLSGKLLQESRGAGSSKSKDKSEQFHISPQLWSNAEIQNSKNVFLDDVEGNYHGELSADVIDVEKGIGTSDEKIDLSSKL